jgi:hypothetical protein
MWVNCHNCIGCGFMDDKKTIPCKLCNYNNTTFIYLVGQLWVEDEYEPCNPPEEPSI